MFGDLFAEEEEDEECPVTVANGKNVGSHSLQKCEKSIPAPPQPRGFTNLCGLINQGGTCYLNSLIQTLFFTPEFREQLFQLGPNELGELSSENSFQIKARVIPLQLQHLFSQMLLIDKSSISTSQLTDSFGWTHNEGFQQHDVQELNRILFSAIESSLVGTSGQNLIRNLYHGTLVSKITCQECGNTSEREENFLDLQMVLNSCSSLEQSLNMFYVMLELMSGDNQYMCERCNKLVDATRGAKLRSLPSILTFSLVRFAYDLKRFERYKETKRYTFPLELDMSEFCEDGKDLYIYELYSVVIHRGSCYGGHYHAYIRDVEGLGNWISPDEAEFANQCVNNKKSQACSAEDIDHNDPMQLISFLITNLGGRASISDLCHSMVKETGKSWNKIFKKRHGPLTKFIKKHPDVFDMVDGAVVTLKHGNTPNKDDSQQHNGHLSQKNGHHNHDKSYDNHVSLEKNICGEEKSSDEDNASCSTDNWFDLNDAKISCIKEQDIKKQFAGKESAYMLFYRRKGLQPTKVDKSCIGSSLPNNLVSEVVLKNIELEKQREEYDMELNRISVILHFCCDYTVKDGVIVPKEQISIGPSVFTLDRRKTVSDFFHLVDERCLLSEQVIHDLAVHTAKRISAGIHLYDDIATCKSRSLADWGISDGSDLFIWCGKQVDGHYIRTGKDCEPVLLSITYPLKDGNSVDIQKPFPKDSTLNELKVSISKISGIKLSKLILSIMKLSKRSKTKIEELGTSLDGSTLQAMDFIDGQRLIVDKKVKQKNTNCHSLCLAKSEAEKCDNQISLVVEYHINYADGQDTNSRFEERPVASFYVDKHKTIGELKNQIMSSSDFKINPDQNCILRVDDVTHGLGPPLYEHQTVEETLLDDGHNIVIEPGTPLMENQIAIRFYCAVIDIPRHEHEIIVDKSCTISQCLSLMVKHVGLEGFEWHLCKTNWYGEETTTIENEDDSLDETEVKHGDLLIVKTGRLPPKGFVRLSLWLIKRYNVGDHDGEGHGTSMISWITTGLQELLGVSHHTTDGKQVEEFESLGEIEISMDAMLVDLKKKIVDIILQGKQYQVPSPKCLRIQDIKDGYPARVLRHHDKTLRFSKVSSSRKLSVQVLESNEELSQSAVLLNVRKRILDRRCYEPSKQLIYDAPNGATSSSLHQYISEMFDIPVDRLSIAKYLRHKYEWLVISDQPFAQNKSAKTKKHNLRHSPYHLQDGDVIGIKDTSLDNSDDFSTPEDEAAKENQQRTREEKIRRRREERQGGRSRRPEVELKIHVDDFTTK